MIGGTIAETLRLSGRGAAMIEEIMVFVFSIPNGSRPWLRPSAVPGPGSLASPELLLRPEMPIDKRTEVLLPRDGYVQENIGSAPAPSSHTLTREKA